MLDQSADLILVNAHVITLDRRRPRAEALAVRGDRIQHVGTHNDVLALAGSATTILDARGGIAIPAFHDAHLHLLSYARGRSRIDCRGTRSISDLQALVRKHASTSPHEWIRASGYDDALLSERRHPNRWDLDAAVSDQPVRLQHRSRHLDIFNTAALQLLRLAQIGLDRIEMEAESGEPTGRLYNGGELLQQIIPRPSGAELARDVHAASDELLSRGITTVQDATYTNRLEELALFARLAANGDLRLRAFVFRSASHWREFPASGGSGVRIGPIKIMLDEATSDLAQVREIVTEARKAGEPVAFHAVTEAEVAMALDTLRSAPPRARLSPIPDRIEHGAVIPDDWLPDLRALGVCVVGQPALVHERGDVYRREYSEAQHAWLHRARSLLQAGIPYAASSDAPVTDPDPIRGMLASRDRRTLSGALLGREEALTRNQAVAAFTRWPAEAIGASKELGVLRPGALADIVVIDPDALDASTPDDVEDTTRLTIMNGQVVWRRVTP